MTRAVRLLYASLGIGFLKLCTEISALSRSQPASVGFVVVVALFVFAVLWFLIHKLARGRNWARITFLVLFVLGIPVSVAPMLQALATNPASGILGIVQVLFQLVALWLVFRKGAADWFTRSSREPTSAIVSSGTESRAMEGVAQQVSDAGARMRDTAPPSLLKRLAGVVFVGFAFLVLRACLQIAGVQIDRGDLTLGHIVFTVISLTLLILPGFYLLGWLWKWPSWIALAGIAIVGGMMLAIRYDKEGWEEAGAKSECDVKLWDEVGTKAVSASVRKQPGESSPWTFNGEVNGRSFTCTSNGHGVTSFRWD